MSKSMVSLLLPSSAASHDRMEKSRYATSARMSIRIDQGRERWSACVAYQAKGRVVLALPALLSRSSNFRLLSSPDHLKDQSSYRHPFGGHLSASLPGYVGYPSFRVSRPT